MSILTPSMFVGKFAISKAYGDGNSKLQEYIDHYETKYLNELFGAELCTLFLAGYSSVEIYEVLFDAFAYDSPCKGVVISEGIETMLKGFILAHYSREDLGTSTAQGKIMLSTEGGEKISDNYDFVFTVYNQAITTYNAIIQRIKDNSTDYPEFKGKAKELSYFI